MLSEIEAADSETTHIGAAEDDLEESCAICSRASKAIAGQKRSDFGKRCILRCAVGRAAFSRILDTGVRPSATQSRSFLSSAVNYVVP